MADITVNMNLQTRPAIYTPKWNRPHLGLEKNVPIDVDVFGIYQVAVDDEVDAYFVVTLPSGKCTYAGVDEVQFTDVVGYMEEVMRSYEATDSD